MIFYFSGTGNSQYVAKRLSEATGERLISISGCLCSGELTFPEKGERIGFVFPTYFFGIPVIVREFIEKLNLNGYEDNYVYAITTCGGSCGNLFARLRKVLALRGITLNGGDKVLMPDNYILMFNLLTKEDKQAKMLELAERRIDELVPQITGGGLKSPRGNFIKWLVTATNYPFYKYGRNTKHFYALVDCNGCGICQKVCPGRVIEIKMRLPVWTAERCTQCLACLHHCPKRAIQHKPRTEKRGRYLNPNL